MVRRATLAARFLTFAGGRLPARGAALEGFLALAGGFAPPWPADLTRPLAGLAAGFATTVPAGFEVALRRGGPGFFEVLLSAATTAVRMRSISRVTSSMVIMPSTLKSRRRSE